MKKLLFLEKMRQDFIKFKVLGKTGFYWNHKIKRHGPSDSTKSISHFRWCQGDR